MCRYSDKFQGIWIDIPSCEGQLKTMCTVTKLTFITKYKYKCALLQPMEVNSKTRAKDMEWDMILMDCKDFTLYFTTCFVNFPLKY